MVSEDAAISNELVIEVTKPLFTTIPVNTTSLKITYSAVVLQANSA